MGGDYLSHLTVALGGTALSGTLGVPQGVLPEGEEMCLPLGRTGQTPHT